MSCSRWQVYYTPVRGWESCGGASQVPVRAWAWHSAPGFGGEAEGDTRQIKPRLSITLKVSMKQFWGIHGLLYCACYSIHIPFSSQYMLLINSLYYYCPMFLCNTLSAIKSLRQIKIMKHLWILLVSWKNQCHEEKSIRRLVD